MTPGVCTCRGTTSLQTARPSPAILPTVRSHPLKDIAFVRVRRQIKELESTRRVTQSEGKLTHPADYRNLWMSAAAVIIEFGNRPSIPAGSRRGERAPTST